MSRSFLLFNQVFFSYESAEHPLFDCLDVTFPEGWTGIVGPNGSGKTTLLRLAAGMLQPGSGVVRAPGAVTVCDQRTDDVPAGLAALMDSPDGAAAQWRGRLGLDPGWPVRWDTLSHGERKRAQVAAALWRADPVLCLDEPTNHVDAEARRILAGALAAYRGIGLLVSHDRQLLDSLCAQCLFLDPPRALMRPGTWSEGRVQAKQEEESLRRRALRARAEVRAAEHRALQARAEAAAAKKRVSKRDIDRRDIDARSRMDRARISGKDAVAARLARRLGANVERARDRSAALPVGPVQDLGLWFGSEPARRDTLLDLPAGRLPLGPDTELGWPELVLQPRDRVALTGPNGSGKSTLIRHLLPRLRLERDRLLSLPQEIDREESAGVLDRLRGLPRASLGRALTVVNLLGTDPKRLLATSEPSPGEIRKVLIAMGIARVPHLIVLDEPTNHLDLPSVECLEEALAECSCALLLASHDERFLARLTTTRWEIEEGTGLGQRVVRVRA